MSDPVGVQWAIGRANEQYMAGKIEAEQMEDAARGFLSMRNRIDEATASTPQSTPRRSESAGNGQGGGKTGFASPKQENWFKDLLSKAGASDEDVRTVLAHLSATSHGGRGGPISNAIDDLRGDGKGGAAAMLVQAAEDWKERANATPGDTSGLPELQT